MLGKNHLQRLTCLWFGLLIMNWNVSLTHADWPQASGPEGNFQIAGEAVTEFSVSLGKNVKWKAPLPSTGQGGVVVVGDRIFVTSHEEVHADTELGSGILGLCFDASNGDELWRKTIPGVRETDLSSLFSDNTAATPGRSLKLPVCQYRGGESDPAAGGGRSGGTFAREQQTVRSGHSASPAGSILMTRRW